MRYQTLFLLLTAASLIAFVATPSQAASNEVPNLVQQGIDAFAAKQYEEAIKAFEAALEIQPDDPRILFDLGCVKSAQGHYDEAVKLLEDASMTDDTDLAIKCRYNLGQIAVDRAKAVLGEKPEEANEEARAKAIEFVNRAIIDYSTCLEMNPNHPDARHNLELLRIWQKNMEQVWKEKDRQARRESMDLPKFVDWIDKQQRDLRTTGKQLEQQRKSPQRRLALQEASTSQRELSEEIDPLKQKITDMVNASADGPQGPQGLQIPGTSGAPGMMQQTPQAPQQPAISPEQREQIVKALHGLADTAGESMTSASQCLSERMFDDAATSQGKSIEQVDQIGAIIMPYPDLVQKAVAEQRQLTTQERREEAAAETTAMDQGLLEAQRTTGSGASEPMREFTEAIEQEGNLGSETTAVEEAPIAPNVSRTDVDEQPGQVAASEPFDPAEAAWQQRFVERWSQLLIDKAEQGLKNLPPEEPKAEEPKTEESQAASAEEATPGAEEKNTPPAEPEQLTPEQQAAKAQKEKVEGLRESMRRAVELGPEVVRLTNKAARLLNENEVDQAVPNQKEALVLLEKIAEPLKDQDQQNQNQQQQQQQQQQQNQNQDQKDQKDKQDQNQKSQDQKDQKDQKDDKNKQDQNQNQDQQKDDKEKKDQQQKLQQGDKDQKEKEQQKAQAQPRDLSKRQAEALIRKVNERQREAEKVRALIEQKAYGPRKVDKDW